MEYSYFKNKLKSHTDIGIKIKCTWDTLHTNWKDVYQIWKDIISNVKIMLNLKASWYKHTRFLHRLSVWDDILNKVAKVNKTLQSEKWP